MTHQIPPYSQPGLGEENGSGFILLILFGSSNFALRWLLYWGVVLRAGYMQMSKHHSRLWPLESASCRAQIEYSTHQNTGSAQITPHFLLQNLLLQNHKHVIL